MSATYTIILRDCPPASRPGVAQFLGKAFSLKESTCSAIAGSAPIILIPGLNREEAAAMSVALSTIRRQGGVLDFSTQETGDLPKIDWPRRPQVFKREIQEYLEDLRTAVGMPDGSHATLLELVAITLDSMTVDVIDPDEPVIRPATSSNMNLAPVSNPGIAPPPTSSYTSAGPITPAVAMRPPTEFRSMPLPEITPFHNAALGAPAANGAAAEGFAPDSEDISGILDRLLPDEDVPATPTPTGNAASSGSRRAPAVGSGPQQTAVAGGGYSVFLAKIADEARRTKAVALIAELAQLGNDEAEVLSKKVIIPVLKNASKDDAENAKQKFAKIGILARVKGPE